jgi:hypothetical protein
MPQLGFDGQKPDTRPRRRVTRQWTGTPNSHCVGDEGKSGEARVKDAQLTLGDLHACPRDFGLPQRQRAGKGVEKSAEAVVVRSFDDVPSSRQHTSGRPPIPRKSE